MTLPNTERGCPAGEPTEDWTAEQLLAYLRNQYKHLTAPDGKIRKAVAATDDDIRDIANHIAALEKLVAVQKSNPTLAADYEAMAPLEKLEVQRRWFDELCANDNEKARLIGYTDDQMIEIRSGIDKSERDYKEWQRRENAKMILGSAPPPGKVVNNPDDIAAKRELLSILQAFNDIDISAMKAAHESGDEEAAHREFKALSGQLEAKAEKDPVFAKWFEEFSAEQERLLRWDETIDDDDED